MTTLFKAGHIIGHAICKVIIRAAIYYGMAALLIWAKGLGTDAIGLQFARVMLALLLAGTGQILISPFFEAWEESK